MSQKQTFRVRPEHITLLQNTYVSWDDCEFGAPSIDCKRPYGNSSVLRNMAEILNVPMTEDNYGDLELPDDEVRRLYALHRETQTALQISRQLATRKRLTRRVVLEYQIIAGDLSC
jgi:hypothetical protein